MFRLIAFLITGFWPSERSLLALAKRLNRLELDFSTYKKKLNRLWGAYYAEAGSPDDDETDSPILPRAAAPRDFPDDEFNELLEARRRGTTNGGTNA